ncbi:hypothetical protein [Ehrlichia muris]|nr:hypothetical protein [Ehrlichia muris]
MIFFSKELNMEMDQEELIFDIFSSFRHYAILAKSVSRSLKDFKECEVQVTNEYQDMSYYILYMQSKIMLDAGFFSCVLKSILIYLSTSMI